MLVKFSKMCCLGQDFMVVDAVTQKVFFNSDLVSRLSDRVRGVGFSALLLIEPPYDPELDFHCRAFAPDGGEVAPPLAGAPCVARFVVDHHLSRRERIGVSGQSLSATMRCPEGQRVVVDLGDSAPQGGSGPEAALRDFIAAHQGTPGPDSQKMGIPGEEAQLDWRGRASLSCEPQRIFDGTIAID
ncbi:MAG: hypothetical protein K6A65_08880 [Succinivibrionaceae bacterium]|nr:hypothetical protein [Succinivibrionaceae bacterium]